MLSEIAYHPRSLKEFPHWTFETLDLEYDAEAQALWMSYSAEGPPYFSLQRLKDVGDVRATVREMFASGFVEKHPVRYFIMASRQDGVFNLGGDLAMFASAIRDNDRDLLRLYARTCTELVHGLSTAFDLPMVTLSVVEGQALGGGLEGALAEDFVIADENARMGVPEVAFNTFPGMGAMTLLTRRLGTAKAEDIIASGVVMTGEEMYAAGVVDVLAPAGEARRRAREWMISGGQNGFERRRAMAAGRRAIFPVTLGELDEITDLWVACSCDITQRDIRYMERLAATQKRTFG